MEIIKIIVDVMCCSALVGNAYFGFCAWMRYKYSQKYVYTDYEFSDYVAYFFTSIYTAVCLLAYTILNPS